MRRDRRKRRARRDQAPRATKAERELRAAVTGLWACSYAVSPVQRQVLQRRAGLYGNVPTSITGTARALDLSTRTVRRAQRTGLRALRRANRSDGCAMGATQGSTQGAAREAGALVAVATAPALRPIADLAGHPAAATAQGTRAETAEGQVLGQRASSSTPSADGGATSEPAQAQVAAPGSQSFSVLPLLALLLALAAAAALVMLRRGGHRGPPPQHMAVAAPAPIAEPGPVYDEPAAEFDHERPWQEEEPPSKPARWWPAEHVDRMPLPPAYEQPAPASTDTPAEPATHAHSARRAAGLAVSGLASVAVGLLVRARRRR